MEDAPGGQSGRCLAAPTRQADRRSRRARSDDDRVRATRRRLITALTELLRAGEVPTVASVCDRAGIGRSTFYTHYATLEELGASAVDDLFSELSLIDASRRRGAELSREAITRLGLAELLERFVHDRDVLAYSSSRLGAAQLREHLESEMAASLHGIILAERPEASEDFVAVSARYLAGGMTAVLVALLDHPDQRADADVVEVLMDMQPAWLTRAR